jgi:hypothetical protein
MPAPYGSVVQMVWHAGRPGLSKQQASAPGRIAYVYVQAPSSPWFISPVRAWGELHQFGQDGTVLAAPFALLFAIEPVGVLFGPLASRRLVRRVRVMPHRRDNAVSGKPSSGGTPDGRAPYSCAATGS